MEKEYDFLEFLHRSFLLIRQVGQADRFFEHFQNFLQRINTSNNCPAFGVEEMRELVYKHLGDLGVLKDL